MNANREPSDEELDGLFRQAADGLRPRFDPEDWRGMTDRLDAAQPHPRPWWQRWSWLGSAFLLLLLSGGTLWWQASESRGNAQPEARAVAKPATATTKQRAVPTGVGAGVEKSAANHAEPNRMDSPAATGAAPALVADAKKDRVAKTTPPAPTEPSAKTATVADRANTTPTVRPAGQSLTRNATRHGLTAANRPAGKRPLPASKATRTRGVTHSRETTRRPPRSGRNLRKAATELARTDPRPNGFRQERNPSGVPAVKSGKDGTDWVVNAGFDGEQRKTNAFENVDFTHASEATERPSSDLARLNLKTWRVANRQVQLPAVTAPAPAEPLIDRRPAEPTQRGRFGLRAVLAPDLNSVGTFKPSVFGRSYGLLLEYEVLPRLRVQTGVLRSQKDYGSTPADYTWAKGYWSTYPKPDNIDAKCAILDVPLNVRFDVFRRAQSDVFVNGGVSSYLMLNEDYTYRYTNKPSYTHEVNVSRGGGHFATTFNLSLGYQRQLGGGLSLQLEPYLKLPIAGVGFGSVRLYSTGLHLSLGFHPLSRRRLPP